MTEASDAIPVFSAPEEAYAGTVYGDEFARRARNAAAVFEERYGTAPSHVVRAPGRVNLIGEHIDYHGYSVLPMAIEHDVIVAVGRRPGADTVAVSNTDAAYDARELPVDPSADVAAEHHWTVYFHCGYKGAFLLSGAEPLPAPTDGMAAVVDGRVPPAAGLSSSSAVVVAAGLATAAAHGIAVTRTAVADFTRNAERFVGTMSGGMDQAISALAERGAARFISFNPLRADSVQLPPGIQFIVANSMAKAEKATTAVTGYNKRVVEGRLAAMVLARARGLAQWSDIRTLQRLQQELGLDAAGAAALAKAELKPGAYTKAEIAAALSVESVTQDAQFPDRPAAAAVLAASDAFMLRDRAVHVFGEAARVLRFRDLCGGALQPGAVAGGSDVATALGALMSASHASCRDLYECSCPELDELTAAAEAAGALGARLTGAGWGGCAVVLVRDEEAGAVTSALEALYARNGHSTEAVAGALFRTTPAAGAAVLQRAA